MDPFDDFEPCPDDCDGNAPHGSNTEEEMDHADDDTDS